MTAKHPMIPFPVIVRATAVSYTHLEQAKQPQQKASEAPKGAAPVHERPVTAKQPEDFRHHAGKPAMQPASPSIRERGQVPYGGTVAERASVPVVKAASIHHEQTPPVRLSLIHILVSVFAVMLLGNLPPLSFIDGAFLKYFGVPFALTWFMCQKTFDGKKPYGFLKSVLAYLVRPKLTYAGKPVKLEKEYPAQPITAVRSDIYGISD